MAASAKAMRFILYRYLILSWIGKNRRSGAIVGLLLPIFGVGIGVFAFTVVLSIMGGFVDNIKIRLLNVQPHMEIISTEKGKQIPQNPELLLKIKSLSPEILAVSPYQYGDVILQAGDKALMAKLKGVEPASAKDTMGIGKFLADNITLNQLDKKIPAENIKKSALFPSVILGRDLMMQLDLNVGDSLTLVSTLPDETSGGLAPVQFPVVIGGYFNVESFFYNHKLVLTSLSVANHFFQNENTWMGVQVKLRHPFEAEKIAEELNKKLNTLNLQAKPWTEDNKGLLKALALEHWAMSFVMLMIVLVGCFSISISLLLSVRRKSNEMAILRSMGFEQADLSKLFMWQGFLIGLAGVILGLVSAAAALYFIHNYHIPLITSSYSNELLPVSIGFLDIVIISFGTLILAMLAAVWPAVEVRNLDVVEILTVRN